MDSGLGILQGILEDTIRENGGEAACRIGCRLSDTLSPDRVSVADRQHERGIGETTFRTFAKADGLELDAASFVLHLPVSKP
jgi:hypothetical protein